MSDPRSAPRSLLALALSMGVGAGALEVGLRVQPRMGLHLGQIALWIAISAALSVLWMLGAAAAAWLIGRRVRGLLLAALIVLHAAIWYRFDVVLNEFLGQPRVWAGLLGIGLGSLIIGLLLDGPLRRWSRGAIVGALLMGVVGVGLAGLRSAEPAGQPRADGPNVVLITMDTTRADRIGAFGGTNRTPAVDRIALQGVAFDQAIATAPLTEPSHLAILTGIPPHGSGMVSNGTAIGLQPAMLPAVLRERGYLTAGFVSGFPLHGRYGWPQAFDVYDDDFGRVAGLHRLSLIKAWDQVTLPAHALRERRGDLATDRALAWLDRHADDSFFLWLHLFDPHAPYEAPGFAFDPPTDGQPLDLPGYWPPPHRAITSTEWLTQAYEAEIRFADSQVGRLLQALDEHGITDDTIIVFTADHGESLTEHGYLFDHGDHLYDASLRVPLAIRYPAAIPAGQHLGCQVSNLDIAPTVLSMLGIEDGVQRGGVDRLAQMQAGSCDEEAVVSTTVAGRFVATPPVDHSLRARGHKLIRHAAGDGRIDEDDAGAPWEECFNLLSDPAEDHPTADCLSGMSASLDQALSGGVVPVSPQLDAETQSALEALGYVE